MNHKIKICSNLVTTQQGYKWAKNPQVPNTEPFITHDLYYIIAGKWGLSTIFSIYKPFLYDIIQ